MEAFQPRRASLLVGPAANLVTAAARAARHPFVVCVERLQRVARRRQWSRGLWAHVGKICAGEA